jgi:hypothetical protein
LVRERVEKQMAERNGMEQIVERVVSQVLERHVPRLRDELVARVLEELPKQPESSAGSGVNAADLLRAVSLIHAGSTQREILRALLDSAVQYSERVALFVIKAGAATGWQGRGFADNDSIKDFALDISAGAAVRAHQERTTTSGDTSQIDSRFIEQFGKPFHDQVWVLPLLLKDKVAALVYADAGVDETGRMDSAALQLLVASTSAWLEVASLRKQAPKDAAHETAPAERAEAPVPVQTTTSFVDPFAAHAPRHAAAGVAAQADMAVRAAAAATAASPAAEDAQVVVMSPSPEAPPAAAATAGMSPEDADVHRKAQRFAKLLVDEIKLYNQAKVAEGRKNKDLYDRLKDDIESSRATYQKRYGSTVAASSGYFSNEVIRSLAEDDVSIMGGNFRR